MRSKRFEALAKRPVNQDGFVKEWIEEGFIAMESPNDPKPSIRIVNGAVTELDGKPVEQFDLIDHFIARYGINLARAEEVMAMDSVKLANMLCDPNVKRSDIVPLTTAMTPAKIVEVVSHMNVVEMMMAMQKMRARRTPSQQAHVTNIKDNPVQIAADAAEGARFVSSASISDSVVRMKNTLPINTSPFRSNLARMLYPFCAYLYIVCAPNYGTFQAYLGFFS